MSDVEWVEESDWAKVKVGDRIRLESEDEKHEFVVQHPPFSESIFHCFMQYFQSDYTLFVERPVVELPTEPGHYLDCQGDYWKIYESGEWWKPHIDPARYSPFVRLRPVDEVRAETANAIYQGLRSTGLTDYRRGEPSTYRWYSHDYEDLFRVFGVSS